MSSYDTAKKILSRAYPSAVLRPQARADWLGEFPLPDPIAEYFAEFGPDDVAIDGYGNPYFLPSLAHLWAHQTGYRTDGFTQERIADWNDDWLVVADQGGDPFILSRASSVVLHAYHGEGAWEPSEIFGSLPEMATTFAIVGEIVASAGQSLTDDDSLIVDRYLQEAAARVAEFVGSHERALAMISSLGWSQCA